MDVLAGRKTAGIIQGDIRINGHPKEQEPFARVSGYCEQFDVHSPQTTVHEALLFSAELRFDKGVEKNIIHAFVEEVEDLVELANLREALVSTPFILSHSSRCQSAAVLCRVLKQACSLLILTNDYKVAAIRCTCVS